MDGARRAPRHYQGARARHAGLWVEAERRASWPETGSQRNAFLFLTHSWQTALHPPPIQRDNEPRKIGVRRTFAGNKTDVHSSG